MFPVLWLSDYNCKVYLLNSKRVYEYYAIKLNDKWLYVLYSRWVEGLSLDPFLNTINRTSTMVCEHDDPFQYHQLRDNYSQHRLFA